MDILFAMKINQISLVFTAKNACCNAHVSCDSGYISTARDISTSAILSPLVAIVSFDTLKCLFMLF